MLISRYGVVIVSTMMLALYFVDAKSIAGKFILLDVFFLTSMIAYIPLFVVVVIMLVKNFIAFIQSKTPLTLLVLLFFFVYPVVSMYLFNEWFFEVIL